MFFSMSGKTAALLTFPGVIVHEMAHKFFCDITKTPVYKVRYFKYGGDPVGYVQHAPSKDLKSCFWISIGPLLINTILCALLTFPAIFPIFILSVTGYNSIFLFLLWIGLSIGMHAFPSNQDMEELLEMIKNNETPHSALGFAARAFAILLEGTNYLRAHWIDLLYAILVSWFLPWLATAI